MALTLARDPVAAGGVSGAVGAGKRFTSHQDDLVGPTVSSPLRPAPMLAESASNRFDDAGSQHARPHDPSSVRTSGAQP